MKIWRDWVGERGILEGRKDGREGGSEEEKTGLWLPSRLGGTQICSEDLSRGVLVGELDGPDPGAASDVEDAAFFIANRRQVEFVAEADLEHLMCYVETVEFAL